MCSVDTDGYNNLGGKKRSAYSEKALTGRRDSRGDGLQDRQALEDDLEGNKNKETRTRKERLNRLKEQEKKRKSKILTKEKYYFVSNPVLKRSH